MIRPLLILFALLLCTVNVRAEPAAWLEPGEGIGREVVEGLLNDALLGAEPGQRFAIEIAAPALPLANPANGAVEIALQDLRLDPRTERLLAELTLRRADGSSSSVRLVGRARRLIEVALPARPIGRGQLIEAADITTEWLAAVSVPADAARDADAFLGHEARRALPAGRPVRTLDLGTPRLVARGDPVTMVFAGQGIELTSVGQALDNGALGELVRVANADSNSVRRGLVVGPREVRFTRPGDQR